METKIIWEKIKLPLTQAMDLLLSPHRQRKKRSHQTNKRNNKTMKTTYTYQAETVAALNKLREQAPGTVSERDAFDGAANNEPLLILMDSAIRYAKAYRARFEQTMAADYMAKPEIESILSGIRGFLNFDGGLSMERTAKSDKNEHDTKDNGVIESLFWTACEIAGIDGEEL